MAHQKPHPFLPRSAQSPKFLKWLRRTHAWFGISGGAAGLIFAITAITLSHDNFGIETAAETVEFELPLASGTLIDSPDALGAYVKKEMKLQSQWRAGMGMGGGARARPGDAASEVISQDSEDFDMFLTATATAGEPPAIAPAMGAAMGGGMGMGGLPTHAVTFNSSGDVVAASYRPGSDSISISRQERGVLGTINRMHQGVGASLGWTIMGDIFAGALIFLSISGFLMWTRMHGSFLLAVGLVTATAVASAFYFSVSA